MDLDPKLKELAICGVAVLNGAQYEWEHHAPPFLAAGGTQQQLDALWGIRHGTLCSDTGVFSPLELDAIQLTVEMTREVAVSSPGLLRRLREALGERQLVELVGSISSYNMVSRFLVAMNISTEGEGQQTPPGA